MIKSLLAANKSERDHFSIPRSVQQSIPIRRIYGDGIWQVGRKHSRTWRFADVNYAAASEEEQRSIFLSYGGVLNALPTDAAARMGAGMTSCSTRPTVVCMVAMSEVERVTMEETPTSSNSRTDSS